MGRLRTAWAGREGVATALVWASMVEREVRECVWKIVKVGAANEVGAPTPLLRRWQDVFIQSVVFT